MTTHIFLALGLWDEVVSQNVIASGADRSAWRPGHYTIWLGYGLLQQGRLAEARAHLELVRKNLGTSGPAGQRNSLIFMRANHVINAESWTDTTLMFPVDLTGTSALTRETDTFLRAYVHLKRGNAAAAGQLLPSLDSSEVLHLQIDGLLKLARHDSAGGLAALRRAAAIEDTLPMAFGPPEYVKPSHELLGEQFLALGRNDEARRSFQRALELAPRRMRSLLGLARAAKAEGDKVVFEQALTALRSQLRDVREDFLNSL
jgi:tetratricopeptide (TPR) repeat protein